MSTKIFSNTLRIAIAATALAGSAAEAKPHRVVIQDFDGPRKIADLGHSAVVNIIGAEYDLVSPKRWEQARADAGRTTHGPAVWQKAARASGADAIIEGFINDEGRKHVLTLIVREAITGNEVDQVTIKVPDAGLNADGNHQLQTSLDAVLDWIEPQYTGETTHLDRATKTPQRMIGAKPEQPEARVKSYDSDDDQPVTTKKHRRDDADSTDDAPVRKSRARQPIDDGDDSPPPAPRKRKVSVLDDDTAPVEKKIVVGAAEPADDGGHKVLVDLFPPPQDVVVDGVDLKPVHRPEPTPKLNFSVGYYYQSRQLEFVSGDQTGPMEYNGTALGGFQVTGEFYPFPSQKMNGKMQGFGVSATLGKATNAAYTFDDGDTTADYSIDQSFFELGAHYRVPLNDTFMLDGHLSYGQSHHIINDAPEELEVPDVSYSWIGAGFDVDIAVGDHGAISFGGSYLHMLDAGDLTSEDWYGSGNTTGIEAHVSFTIPVYDHIYIKPSGTYRRVNTDFNGDGTLTQLWGVVSATDTSLGGSVELGYRF